MIVEIRHYSLILALAVALVQSVLPLAGAARRHYGRMAVGRSTALAQFALIGRAMASLMHAYITSDFTVLNVVQKATPTSRCCTK
jgi:cytochrome c-type biogenesis protein CcmF